MPALLARLRDDLDFLPSPLPDRPGLLVRDPLRYSEVALVLPPLLGRCLGCFDGGHSQEQLRALVGDLTGRPDSDDVAGALVRGLSESGFLDDQVFRDLRATTHRSFAQSPVRLAAFAGGGYPDNLVELKKSLLTWVPQPNGPPPFRAKESVEDCDRRLVAIAAPHVSPEGGVSSYGAAYGALGDELGDRTFVILGTSHYGRPNRFGLTRKTFETPLGQALTDVALVDRLEKAAPGAIDLEDYCHAVEHSIEFQVLFLQNRFGPGVKILPILCGPMVGHGRSARPEGDDDVARVLEALGQLRTARGSELFWILGVDMAHVGRRYGDPWSARAHAGAMNEVAARDRQRMEHLIRGDAEGFWASVHERGEDDLKWCGSAPIYAFLRAHPGVSGQILHYQQWNIDDQSVVSFGALSWSE